MADEEIVPVMPSELKEIVHSFSLGQFVSFLISLAVQMLMTTFSQTSFPNAFHPQFFKSFKSVKCQQNISHTDRIIVKTKRNYNKHLLQTLRIEESNRKANKNTTGQVLKLRTRS